MIPTRLLLDWQPHAPWPTEDQVEQDLLLTRLLVMLCADEEAASMLAFRGGTALHKLLFCSPSQVDIRRTWTLCSASPARSSRCWRSSSR